MTRLPTVSVVIPAYNRAALIGRAIDSVVRQTRSDWELIIVDDGSDDDLASALLPYAADDRIRCERHSVNRGVSAARNTGIDAARGTYVAFLDSDDEWLPLKLERQIEAVEACADPMRVFCATQTRIVTDGDWVRIRPTNGVQPGRTFADFLYESGGFAQVSSFMLPRAIAAKIRFHEQLRQYEDHLFFLAAGREGLRYVLVPEPLSVWHNEERADRLSAAENEIRAEQFLGASEGIMTERERLAFRVRTLFALTWQRNRLYAMSQLAKGVAQLSVSPRYAAEMLIRTMAPRPIYEWLRRRAS